MLACRKSSFSVWISGDVYCKWIALKEGVNFKIVQLLHSIWFQIIFQFILFHRTNQLDTCHRQFFISKIRSHAIIDNNRLIVLQPMFVHIAQHTMRHESIGIIIAPTSTSTTFTMCPRMPRLTRNMTGGQRIVH